MIFTQIYTYKLQLNNLNFYVIDIIAYKNYIITQKIIIYNYNKLLYIIILY